MWTKIERRWVGGAALILIALFGIPLLWGWLNPPAGWQLYRNWSYAGDYTQYRAAMAQGHAGAWLIVNRFTPEPHNPILQYPLYAALGHIARWLHLPLEIPYVLASGGAIIALAFALYDCAAAFLSEQRDRRLAFLLTLSIGPAWVISILQKLLPTATFLSRYRNAFNRPEGNTLFLFAAAPHLPLALAIVLCLLADLKRRHADTPPAPHPPLKFATLYVLLPLLLGLLNPFSLPTLLLPAGIWWLWCSIKARRPLIKTALPLLVMGLTSLPLVAYNYITFSQDPFWGTAYGSQNTQISFPPDVVAIGFGLTGLLALIGAWQRWRAETPQRLLPTWALCVLLMGYLPLSYQRRFTLGLAPALAILAVAGWRWLAQTSLMRRARRRTPLRVIGNTLLILLLWSQNIMIYSAYVMSYNHSGPTPYVVFQPQALAEAAMHIDAAGENSHVLTCEELGNQLAGEINGRVVLGHSGATLNVQQRREIVAAFFAGELTPEEQNAFLEQHGVSHILTSAQAPLLCGAAYIPQPGWSLSFEKGGLHVYRHTP